MPQLVTFQYDAKVPASWQWQVGVQMALPWASSLDVSYVGNHGYDRLGALQGGSVVNLNAVDIGAAFLPQNQDPTLGTSAAPGANAYNDNLLRRSVVWRPSTRTPPTSGTRTTRSRRRTSAGSRTASRPA